MITINGQIFENVYTSAEWATANPVLDERQQGFDSTVKAFKIGDGVTAWLSLPFYYGSSTSLPDTITVPISTALPIIIDYETNYSEHGDYPTIQIRSITGRDITSTSTIDYGAAIPLDTISINAADDGSGVTDSEILIIIKN